MFYILSNNNGIQRWRVLMKRGIWRQSSTPAERHENMKTSTYKPRRRSGKAPFFTALRRNAPGRTAAQWPHSTEWFTGPLTVCFPLSSISACHKKVLCIKCWVEVTLMEPTFYHLPLSNLCHNLLPLRFYLSVDSEDLILTVQFGTATL